MVLTAEGVSTLNGISWPLYDHIYWLPHLLPAAAVGVLFLQKRLRFVPKQLAHIANLTRVALVLIKGIHLMLK